MEVAGEDSHAASVTQTATDRSEYKPQFNATRDLILRRIRATEHAQSSRSIEDKDARDRSFRNTDLYTIPLPGVIPHEAEDVPVATDTNSGPEDVDFTQSTVFFRPPTPPDVTMEDAPTTLSGPLEEQRQQWLASLPEGIAPAKAELVGFTSGQTSTRSLTEYFYGKKKTDLLNIVSFCDQLEPQLLVDLLVSVARKHPDLPIFDSPDWEAAILAQEASKAAAMQLSRIHQRPRHGHTLLNPRMRKRGKAAVKKMAKRANMTPAEKAADENEEDDEGEDEEEDEDDVLPETWPQAGEGLYAKLPPEVEDRSFLADAGDEEAFSHFMVDVFGRPAAVEAF